jgi:hypothetical protein
MSPAAEVLLNQTAGHTPPLHQTDPLPWLSTDRFSLGLTGKLKGSTSQIWVAFDVSLSGTAGAGAFKVIEAGEQAYGAWLDSYYANQAVDDAAWQNQDDSMWD